MIDKVLKISRIISLVLIILMLSFLQFKEIKKTMIEKNIFSNILKNEINTGSNEELQNYYYACENINEKGEIKQY